eukprot:COSAG02_NODE_67640_length_252_cov_1.000000_1_plen_30_part_10
MRERKTRRGHNKARRGHRAVANARSGTATT